MARDNLDVTVEAAWRALASDAVTAFEMLSILMGVVAARRIQPLSIVDSPLTELPAVSAS
jgi:hypothetical protein